MMMMMTVDGTASGSPMDFLGLEGLRSLPFLQVQATAGALVWSAF